LLGGGGGPQELLCFALLSAEGKNVVHSKAKEKNKSPD
jgi:hypothetical protein